MVRYKQVAGLEPAPWAAQLGSIRASKKHVVERCRLTNDGYGMSVSYTLEDPVYVPAPVTVTGECRKVADHEL
ncbi:MAG TPA: hypothetical protein VJA26_05250 [Gammaproteobacteria bacterium]|nr:hypothetical protein [Gammaproteobacteria bacterium]